MSVIHKALVDIIFCMFSGYIFDYVSDGFFKLLCWKDKILKIICMIICMTKKNKFRVISEGSFLAFLVLGHMIIPYQCSLSFRIINSTKLSCIIGFEVGWIYWMKNASTACWNTLWILRLGFIPFELFSLNSCHYVFINEWWREKLNFLNIYLA